MKTLYEMLKEAGIEIENHESDMFFRETPDSTRILCAFRAEFGESMQGVVSLDYRSFRDVKTGERWYEVPFMYDPYWAEKRRRFMKYGELPGDR